MKRGILFGLVSTLPYLAVGIPAKTGPPNTIDKHQEEISHDHHEYLYKHEGTIKKRSPCGDSKSVNVAEPSRRTSSNAQIDIARLADAGREGSGQIFNRHVTDEMTQEQRMAMIRFPAGREPSKFRGKHPFGAND